MVQLVDQREGVGTVGADGQGEDVAAVGRDRRQGVAGNRRVVGRTKCRHRSGNRIDRFEHGRRQFSVFESLGLKCNRLEQIGIAQFLTRKFESVNTKNLSTMESCPFQDVFFPGL